MIGIYALVMLAILLGLLIGLVMSSVVAEWGEDAGIVKTQQGEKHEGTNNTD